MAARACALASLAACVAVTLGGGAMHGQSAQRSCPPVLDAAKFAAAWTDTVIGPGNRDHTCLRQLLTPDARIVGAVPGKDGRPTLEVESPNEFVAWYEKRPAETFWERTLHSSFDIYENVARVTRTYEVRASPTGPIQSRGIEDFQLIFDGRTWRAFSLLWQDEVHGNPLPRRYLTH
jgi:hypothetical protein